jgi:hypothetical protein
MRIQILLAWVFVSTATLAAGQSPQPRPLFESLFLAGCASAGDSVVSRSTAPGRLVSQPEKRRRDYTLWRVGTGHRINVVGRLIPSANVAGQEGSLNVAIPAMALVSGDQYRADRPSTRKPAVPIITAPHFDSAVCPSQ